MRINATQRTAIHLCLIVGLMFAAWSASGSNSAAQPAAAAMPPEKVQQLIKLLDDPEIRAWLATKPKTVPAPAIDGVPSGFTLWTNGIREHLRAVIHAVPALPGDLLNAGRILAAKVSEYGFWSAAFLLLIPIFCGMGLEVLFRKWIKNTAGLNSNQPPDDKAIFHEDLAQAAFVKIAPIAVFSIVSFGAFLILALPPLFNALVVPLLLALIGCRMIICLSELLLAPGKGEAHIRLLPMEDISARFWSRRTSAFTIILFAGWAAAGVLAALAIPADTKSLIVYCIGIGLLAVAVEAVWHRPGPRRDARDMGTGGWLLVASFCILWLFWIAGMNILLWLGIYAIVLPGILRATSAIVQTVFDQYRADESKPVFEVLVDRGARALIITLAVIWLAMVVRLHPTVLTEDAAASKAIRGVLSGVVILLVADMLWHVAKSSINHRLERARQTSSDAAELARSGRLLTLLPILRNFLAVLIAVIAIMMVLSGLGVEVGPLIAGAGIFGVAIGFGSQTLVKDVISGVFYMMDDAFRVGEYIQSGSYKGTVESFSIRSVKLRHHRGPIFTVPFGMLGAVQNMSRDWVIDKFLISVSYNTDIAQVKKVVKTVGATLLEDPEFGPQIIETVKMKGVEAFGDYGINLSFAMMTKPGHQSTIRRRAYAMIRDAFTATGIEFASPTVQVAGDDHSGSVAAAATNDAIHRKKAADAAKAGES